MTNRLLENPCKATLYKRGWIEKNRESVKAYKRNWHQVRRQKVLDHYGGQCACCKEDTFEFLALDHKNGGGEQHRTEVGQGSRMIDWVLANDYPEIFQVMCHNCNQARGYYGICPHQRDE